MGAQCAGFAHVIFQSPNRRKLLRSPNLRLSSRCLDRARRRAGAAPFVFKGADLGLAWMQPHAAAVIPNGIPKTCRLCAFWGRSPAALFVKRGEEFAVAFVVVGPM